MMITTGWEKYASIEGEAELKKALTQVVRERNLAEETLTRVETERIEAIRERDEARRAVHEIIDSVTSVVDGAAGQKIWSQAVKKWPWLREIADQ